MEEEERARGGRKDIPTMMRERMRSDSISGTYRASRQPDVAASGVRAFLAMRGGAVWGWWTGLSGSL